MEIETIGHIAVASGDRFLRGIVLIEDLVNHIATVRPAMSPCERSIVELAVRQHLEVINRVGVRFERPSQAPVIVHDQQIVADVWRCRGHRQKHPAGRDRSRQIWIHGDTGNIRRPGECGHGTAE